MSDIEKRELVDKLNSKQSYIVIEGDLAKQVIRIKAVGSFGWAIVIAALSAGLVIILGSGGTASFVAAPAAGVSVLPILGLSATLCAVDLVRFGSGLNPLKSIRNDYDIIEKTHGKVVIQRR